MYNHFDRQIFLLHLKATARSFQRRENKPQKEPVEIFFNPLSLRYPYKQNFFTSRNSSFLEEKKEKTRKKKEKKKRCLPRLISLSIPSFSLETLTDASLKRAVTPSIEAVSPKGKTNLKCDLERFLPSFTFAETCCSIVFFFFFDFLFSSLSLSFSLSLSHSHSPRVQINTLSATFNFYRERFIIYSR